MLNLNHKILKLISDSKKIFVAYSGGLDSHVLLHILVQLCKSNSNLELTAIHVNHNISPNAKLWDDHCRKTCEALKVKYISESVDPFCENKGRSVEEVLRKLRYEVFAKILPQDAILMTAHHADDQAETLLLQLFRGAGPKGLAAMPKKTKFAQGWLVRPLIELSRKELEQYAKENQLKWIEDESNIDKKFSRNFIRHDLMPLIKKKWPGVVTTLCRVADHSAEASYLLEDIAKQDLRGLACPDSDVLNLEGLLQLDFVRQKNVLRFWISHLNLPMPSDAKLNEIIRNVVCSRYDAVPVVKWGGAEVRRFRNILYAMPELEKFDNKIELYFDDNNEVELPASLGTLQLIIPEDSKFEMEKIKVKFRQGGEKIKLSGQTGRKELKKLFQYWDVPSWLRDRVPIVYHNDEIIAVVGYYTVNDIDLRMELNLKKSHKF